MGQPRRSGYIYLVQLRFGWSIYIFLTVGVVHTSPPEDGSRAPATLSGVPGDHGGCGRHPPGPAKTAEGDFAKKDRRGPSHVTRPARRGTQPPGSPKALAVDQLASSHPAPGPSRASTPPDEARAGVFEPPTPRARRDFPSPPRPPPPASTARPMRAGRPARCRSPGQGARALSRGARGRAPGGSTAPWPCRVRAPGLTRTRHGPSPAPVTRLRPSRPSTAAAHSPARPDRPGLPLHILSDHRWGDATRAIVPCPKRISITHDLLCTWSVHGTSPIVSGPFLLRKSGHPPALAVVKRRSGTQLASSRRMARWVRHVPPGGRPPSSLGPGGPS